jgi:hypothetical protein
MMPTWSTACPDWKERIVNRQSLVTFDALFPGEAEAALSIFRDLHIVDVPGRPTIGECCLPWVYDLPRALFGSYDADGSSAAANLGRRLIRYFFLCVAKKNTKSTLAAGIMVTALLRNWRDSGEFYILAPTKEVADNSFFPARDMIRADEQLLKLLHVQDSMRLITHRTTGAFLKVAAADSETVSGKKTIGLLVDELWLFGQRAAAESMIREAEGGLNSRPEGFVIYATTQSNKPPSGVFEQKLTMFRDIRDGKLNDPESLPIIYEFPEEMIASKAYEDPANWYVPNPNWGKSVDPNFLIAKRREAARNGKSSLIDWDSKFLNVQAGMAQRADGWAGAEVWDRGVDKTITLDSADGAQRSHHRRPRWRRPGRPARRRRRRPREADQALARLGHGADLDHRPLPPQGQPDRIPQVHRQRRPGRVPLPQQGCRDRRDRSRRRGAAGRVSAARIDRGRPAVRHQVHRRAGREDPRRGLLAQVGVDAAGIGAIVDALAGASASPRTPRRSTRCARASA